MTESDTREILSREAVDALLEWYRTHARDLPWRRTRDPYRIWISEIMLQQTRVEAVKPYYERFLAAFPTVNDLACASDERLFKLWEGLGYYSRARNLRLAAQMIVRDYSGELPADEKLLRMLPGVGDYTAGAVASIAFDIRAPAVDGNVLRVLSRVTGSMADVTLPETKSRFRDALRSIVPADAGSFTQSLIELGAVVCVPNGEALCSACPLSPFCVARRDGLCDEIPVRSAKRPRRVEERTVLLIRDGRSTAIRRRPEHGLLAGLYEYPNLPGHILPDALPAVVRSLGFEPLRILRLSDSRHLFTHIEWRMIAYDVTVAPEFDGYHPTSGFLLVNDGVLFSEYPVPSAFAAYTGYLRGRARS